MQQEEFSFSRLEKCIEEYLSDAEQAKPSRLERWSFRTALVAAAVTILLGALGGWRYKAVVMVAGLALELIGLGVGIVCMVLRERRNSTFAYASFANDLDRGFDDGSKNRGQSALFGTRA